MTMDRRLLLRGILTGCACCTVVPRAVPAENETSGDDESEYGCYLSPETAASKTDEANAIASNDEGSAINNPKLTKSLGSALVRLSSFFSTVPAFGFLTYSDDPKKELNAFASPRSDPNFAGTSFQVFFGTRMFENELAIDPSGMTILAVLAHEFGHTVQFKYNLDKPLLAGQPNKKKLEIQADILSGYFIGCRKRENPSLSVYEAGRMFQRFGDYQFGDENHHGTPAERVTASEFGFDHGRSGSLSLPAMIKSSFHYAYNL